MSKICLNNLLVSYVMKLLTQNLSSIERELTERVSGASESLSLKNSRSSYQFE